MIPTDTDVEQIVSLFSIGRLPIALGVLATGWLLLAVVSSFLDDLGERYTDQRLTFKKAKALSRFAIYLLFGLSLPFVMVDDSNSQGLISLLALLSVGIGFALKDLVSSLMSGVLLLLDEPFQVGDRIAFAGFYGEVTEMGLRSVRLVTLDDNLVTIPNSQFLNAPVASANAGALDCMVVVPFFLAADADYDTARRILMEVAATSRYVYLDKSVTTVMEDKLVGVRFVTQISVKAYVFDARYEKAFVTDMTVRAKRALRDAGIAGPEAAGTTLVAAP
jgi:small-conductance mechanosensitive channel